MSGLCRGQADFFHTFPKERQNFSVISIPGPGFPKFASLSVNLYWPFILGLWPYYGMQQSVME